MEQPHPWCQRLLTPLAPDAMRSAVPPDDPLWEKTENAMVKLGSLAHSQVDLDAVAADCLTLLATKTKDMRVLAQLLRCLQHPANAEPFATALALFDCWVGAFWTQAWPTSATPKQRLMVQIIRRFEGAMDRVAGTASGPQLAHLLRQAERLQATLGQLSPAQDAALDDLLAALRRAKARQHEQARVDGEPAAPREIPATPAATASAPPAIDSSNERAWRQTLLNVADLLVEQQPTAAVGYRLRRHAIWGAITTAPLAAKGQQTQLSPVSSDRVNEYQAALSQADSALWKQIEQSLTLSPYWFDGHRLSAQVATRLGYKAVASAIASELERFLAQLPALRTLTFSDGTPFLPDSAVEWLQSTQSSDAPRGIPQDLAGEVKALHKEKGMNDALALLDERTRQAEPRQRFYASLTLADLLAEQGMHALAQASYQQLWQEAQRLGLAQWEPGLVTRLERAVRTLE